MDIKLVSVFPGTNLDVTPQQIVDQFNKVVEQIENGDYEVIDFESTKTI